MAIVLQVQIIPIKNDTLTIKASYLKTAFENNPEQPSLIFTYTFERGNQTHLGFITIKK